MAAIDEQAREPVPLPDGTSREFRAAHPPDSLSNDDFGAIGSGRMNGVPRLSDHSTQCFNRTGGRRLARAESASACQAAPNIGGVVADRT